MAKTVIKVSVVLPTYNRAYCLGSVIDSVVSQTYSEWELIIVDNNSDDGTREVVQGYKDPRIRFMQIENKGIIAFSRNCGINAAEGEFIAFIDSDDPWLPQKLEYSMEMLSCGYDIVYHDLYISNGESRLTNKRTRVSRRLTTPVIEDLIRNGNGLNTSSVVAKTELVRALKGFSESPELVGIEDYDLWVRIARVTDMFGFIESPLGYYTMDGSGTLNEQVIKRCLLGLVEHHREVHMSVCGGTPKWIHLALAKISLKSDPRAALKNAFEVLGSTGRVMVQVKALAIALLATIELGRKKISRRVK